MGAGGRQLRPLDSIASRALAPVGTAPYRPGPCRGSQHPWRWGGGCRSMEPGNLLTRAGLSTHVLSCICVSVRACVHAFWEQTPNCGICATDRQNLFLINSMLSQTAAFQGEYRTVPKHRTLRSPEAELEKT